LLGLVAPGPLCADQADRCSGDAGKQGDERNAVRQYQNCVQLAADEPDCHRVLGMAYLDLGSYVDAESEFRVAIALAKTPTADLLLSLAGALMYQERSRGGTGASPDNLEYLL